MELFHSLAVSAKLQQMNLTGFEKVGGFFFPPKETKPEKGNVCNVDVAALMDLAAERGVHWKSYRTWIAKQVTQQQQQQLMFEQKKLESLFSCVDSLTGCRLRRGLLQKGPRRRCGW
jgi:hypothetical protein